MPTVLRVGPFRFHFYSDEGNEPAHVHVRRDDCECKFRLEPVSLASNKGISPNDLRDIERLVFEHNHHLLEKYHEFFQK